MDKKDTNPANPPPDTVASVSGLSSLAQVLDRMREEIPPTDPEEREREAQIERDSVARGRWLSLVNARGSTYQNCWLVNYKTYDPRQTVVLASMFDYCKNITENIAGGKNLFLYGPSETGKDHLVMAVAREAIRAGHHVYSVNGIELFAEMKDGFSLSRSDMRRVDYLKGVKVLWVSDPLPTIGAVMKEWAMDVLYRIVDDRRNRGKPTWVTTNVTNMREAEDRLSTQTTYRLTRLGLSLHCDWPRFGQRGNE